MEPKNTFRFGDYTSPTAHHLTRWARMCRDCKGSGTCFLIPWPSKDQQAVAAVISSMTDPSIIIYLISSWVFLVWISRWNKYPNTIPWVDGLDFYPISRWYIISFYHLSRLTVPWGIRRPMGPWGSNDSISQGHARPPWTPHPAEFHWWRNGPGAPGWLREKIHGYGDIGYIRNITTI